MSSYLFWGILLVVGLLLAIVYAVFYMLLFPIRAFLSRFVFNSYKRRFSEIKSELPKLAEALRTRREKLEREYAMIPWNPVEGLYPPELYITQEEIRQIKPLEAKVRQALRTFEE